MKFVHFETYASKYLAVAPAYLDTGYWLSWEHVYHYEVCPRLRKCRGHNYVEPKPPPPPPHPHVMIPYASVSVFVLVKCTCLVHHPHPPPPTRRAPGQSVPHVG
ncbi:unnamed protein product [Mesocestoides corti]|uniref:Uncharacterized protein n=1 Tax=Mesocestoides corti TaxID=53468 RepID=A0A0R3U3G8_MESCO|nr:unnamed protein product [Mesocestoides corti]